MSATAKAVLSNNLLLRGLPEPVIDRLAALAIRRTVSRGACLFRQGDPGDALYGVISGQVRISADHTDGREISLSLIDSGESFGEIAVIDGRPRTASAVATKDTVLFAIRRSDLLALVEREPALARHLLESLCTRLRWTSELIEEAAFLDLPARLARRLLRLSQEHGSADAQGRALQLSQAELASFLNASRQMVNQQLRAWRARGWVSLSRGVVVVRDAAALAALSGGRTEPGG